MRVTLDERSVRVDIAAETPDDVAEAVAAQFGEAVTAFTETVNAQLRAAFGPDVAWVTLA